MEKTKKSKYHWLKLSDDFFKNVKLRKIKKLPGGDNYTIILLKLMLLSLKGEGFILIDRAEDTLEELGFHLDENPDAIQAALVLLKMHELIEEVDGGLFLTSVPALIGAEGSSAGRMRALREKKKASQCDADVTTCDEEVTPLLHHCDTQVTTCDITVTPPLQNSDVRERTTERERDKEQQLQQEDSELSLFVFLDEYLKLKTQNAVNPPALAHTIRTKLTQGVSSYLREYESYTKARGYQSPIPMTDMEILRHKLIGIEVPLSTTNALGGVETIKAQIMAVDGSSYEDYAVLLDSDLGRSTVPLSTIVSALPVGTRYDIEDMMRVQA